MASDKKVLLDKVIRSLIVDDEADIRELLFDLVEETGVKADTVPNGTAALEKIEDQDYNLIITDIKMPGANGIEVLKGAKTKNPNVLVIIITGYASLETAIEAIKIGAYDYITKPFKLDEMKIAIRNACEKINLQRENKALIEKLKDAYQELAMLKQLPKHSQSKNKEAIDQISEKQQKMLSSLLNGFPPEPLPLHLHRRKNDKVGVLLELEKLGKLLETGILSPTEFERCKDKLLLKF